MRAGEIWRHEAYPTENGKDKPKFVLILGFASGDLVVRTLTSREHLRSKDVCSHDPIKPHYALGILDPAVGLGMFSWLDLLGDDDIEQPTWDRLVRNETLGYVMTLPKDLMCPLLRCAFGARDTTKNQGKAMLASREALGC